MPKEITLDDGSKETVYTEEEIKGYKQGAEKNKERKESLSKLEKELGLQEGEKIEDKLQELKENANPNFSKYRAKSKADAKKLKELGFEHDEEGNIIDGNNPITAEEIKKMMKETTLETLSMTEREKALSQYKEEDKKLVEHYLNKLSNTGGTFEENLSIAEKLAFPNQDISSVKIANNNAFGGAPRRQDPNKKSFSDTEEGKALLEKLAPPQAKSKK